MEEIGTMDVLMVPVGGIVTLGLNETTEFIRQAEPKIVLPMHFKTEGLEKTFDELSSLNDFLTKFGVDNPEKTDKLSVAKDKLPEETKVILLERKN